MFNPLAIILRNQKEQKELKGSIIMNAKKEILKIEIKEGKFVSAQGGGVSEFRSDFVHGNDWRCKFYDDQSIRCKCIVENDQIVSFKISQFGYATLARTCGGERTEIRRYKLRRWPRDGVITLVKGDIDETFAYFQDSEYLEFLTTQNIFAIKTADPNCTYTTYKCLSVETGKYVNEEILTDGRIIEIGTNNGRTRRWSKENPDTISYEEYRVLRVVDATWVITSREDSAYLRTKRILYTLKDFNEIGNLP